MSTGNTTWSGIVIHTMVDFAIADNDKSVIESKEKQGSRGT